MVVKEAVYETCKCCGHRTLFKESVMCCDSCKKILEDGRYLNSTVFYNAESKTTNFYFCSWKCFFKKMRKVKTDYFISPPMLHYDDKDGVPASEFWKYIKKEGVK